MPFLQHEEHDAVKSEAPRDLLYRVAAEVCDQPGQGRRETGFHHPVAYGEAAGMMDLWLGLIEDR